MHWTSAAVFAAVDVAHALQLRQPRPTPIRFDLEARDPVQLLPTPAPQPHGLQRRAGQTVFLAPDATCGFLTGDVDQPFTCIRDNAQCAISTAVSTVGYIGCCADGVCDADGIAQTACVDSAAYYTGTACGAACRADASTLHCTASTRPFCNTLSINGGPLKITGYFCGSLDVSTNQAIYTTYDGETDGRSFSPSIVSATASSDVTASFGGPEASSSGSSSGSSSSSSSGSGSTSSKKSNTGAIVGGVVGGVAGLAIIGAAVFFLLRRQKAKTTTTPPPGDPAPGAGPGGFVGGPGAPPPTMSQQQYAPPQQYYAPVSPNTTGTTQPVYYQHQQPQYYQGAAVPGFGGVPSPVAPDRADSASPHKPGPEPGSFSPAVSQGPTFVSNEHRMSSVSALSPQTTGATVVNTGTPGPQVPATIHEAGGNAVGDDLNANHRGTMAELA